MSVSQRGPTLCVPCQRCIATNAHCCCCHWPAGQFFLSSIVLLLCKLYRRVQSMLTTIQRQPAIAHRECAMHGAIIFPQSARLPCKPPGFICGAARNIAGPSGPFRIESTTQSCRVTSGHTQPCRIQDHGHPSHRHGPRVATLHTPTSVPTGSIPKQDLWRLGLQIAT